MNSDYTVTMDILLNFNEINIITRNEGEFVVFINIKIQTK